MLAQSTLAEIDPDLMKEFLSGCDEHIAGAEQALMQLEKNPGSSAVIDDVFRHFHSLKGDAASIGIGAIRDLAHELESILDELRLNPAHLTAELLDLLLEGLGALGKQLKQVEAGHDPHEETELVARLSTAQKNPGSPSQGITISKIAAVSELVQRTGEPEAEIKSDKTFIIFRTGNLRCAINVADSNEIIAKSHVTPVPNVEKYIEGVINLRGSIVPVINLSSRLRIAGDPGDNQQVLVLIIDGNRLGLLVDEVLEVTTWPDEKHLRPGTVAFDLERTFVSSVIVEDSRINLILNLKEIIKREI